MTYDYQIRLERKFANEIKKILGLVFIGQDAEMDRKQATDFLVLNIKPFKVACRLRTYNYYLNEKYRQQFTIRCELFNGGKTELEKIREGFADYIFYGFVDEKEENIIQYFIGDLNIFRDYEGGMSKEIYQNKDENPTKLACYYVNSFPENFVINYKV